MMEDFESILRMIHGIKNKTTNQEIDQQIAEYSKVLDEIDDRSPFEDFDELLPE
jgi:hypothetical protein